MILPKRLLHFEHHGGQNIYTPMCVLKTLLEKVIGINYLSFYQFEVLLSTDMIVDLYKYLNRNFRDSKTSRLKVGVLALADWSDSNAQFK